ncbi:NifU family protein [Pontibacter sp. G13]|uniref:NifU family protein n=1 Tax=Pontibacter sp. G13 TaxID=3074898 RepID=UPI00288A7F2E|nr:NifU family protein [Pontibacter sp. G13]WNJ16581.1 NifU family protein [Pontibacter sp. G13]
MKRTVIMHVEGVPNPNAMKFVVENGILTDEPYEFRNLVEADFSPLAKRLLMLRYVDRVMINKNYVTVVKNAQDSPAWDTVTFEIRMLISQLLESNEPVIYYGIETNQHKTQDEVIREMAGKLLDKHIRPAAQEDGGDIVMESFKDGVLNLSMHGACNGCPYASQTIKQGVEQVLTQMIPEIRKVTATANQVN